MNGGICVNTQQRGVVVVVGGGGDDDVNIDVDIVSLLKNAFQN